MTDLTHLNALTASLAREEARLASAKTQKERGLRGVWVSQTKKEIAAEYKFLGIDPVVTCDLSDDELLAELGA